MIERLALKQPVPELLSVDFTPESFKRFVVYYNVDLYPQRRHSCTSDDPIDSHAKYVQYGNQTDFLYYSFAWEMKNMPVVLNGINSEIKVAYIDEKGRVFLQGLRVQREFKGEMVDHLRYQDSRGREQYLKLEPHDLILSERKG